MILTGWRRRCGCGSTGLTQPCWSEKIPAWATQQSPPPVFCSRTRASLLLPGSPRHQPLIIRDESRRLAADHRWRGKCALRFPGTLRDMADHVVDSGEEGFKERRVVGLVVAQDQVDRRRLAGQRLDAHQ